jgi:hypothetical protein
VMASAQDQLLMEEKFMSVVELSKASLLQGRFILQALKVIRLVFIWNIANKKDLLRQELNITQNIPIVTTNGCHQKMVKLWKMQYSTSPVPTLFTSVALFIKAHGMLER